jgi:hypothetical protein
VYVVTAALVAAMGSAAPSVPRPPDPLASPHPRWSEPVVHTLALLTVMRATEAYLWPDPFASTSLSTVGAHYREAYTKPPLFDPSERPFQWDHDRWTINVFGHALFGSEVHVRARQCDFGLLGALAFTTVTTITWEYGVEASGVRPSALDLVYTPLAGLVLGEARYWIFRQTSSITSPTTRGVLRALVDPFGELERAIGTKC